MLNQRYFIVFALLVGTFTGCASAIREDQLLTEVANMDKQEVVDRAEALYAQGDDVDARKYFSFVYDTFPNDPLGHKAALRVADTYAAKRDTASLTEARLRFRDFANRYPNDPDRDYALLMVGQTYSAKQMKPDRDLSTLHEALHAYEQMITLYPDSVYREEGEKRIGQLRDVLAEHELITAEYYFRNKRWLAAQWRIEYLKENYPDYARIEEADALLEESKRQVTEVQEKMQKIIDAKRKSIEKNKQQSAEDEKPAGDGQNSPGQ